MKCETTAVVEQEERFQILGSMVFRTDAQFVSDAVSGSHQFCIRCMRQFVSIFYVLCSGSFIQLS